MLRFIEKHPGIVFCAALLLGLTVPVGGTSSAALLTPLMIFLLFLSFLYVDMPHVTRELKRPGRLISQIFLQYIALPVVLYMAVRLAGFPTFALAVFLLSCMPAGLGSPVFTGIANGRTETSVVFSVLTHLLVPITVPLLFWKFASVSVNVNAMAIAYKLLILICVPILLAWLSRMFASQAVAKIKPHRKVLSILALACVAYTVIVPYADTIRQDALTVLPLLIGTYAFFAVLCLCSLFLSRGRETNERIALIVSRIYMNNALGIVLAVQFFSKDVALITILSEIPWFTTFGLYLWFQRTVIGVQEKKKE